MLSSAWLADPTDDDNHVEQPCQSDFESSLEDPMVPEQFLEVDMNNFYLPTPPESSELWQDNLLVPSTLAGATSKSPRKSKANQRRLYCPRCTKAFSRTDSLRRHEKLYCRNGTKRVKTEVKTEPS